MIKLRGVHQSLVLASLASFLAGASSVHCGGNAQNSSGFTGTGAGNGNGGSGSGASSGSGLGGQLGIDVQVVDYSAEQIYANDPPPLSCDGGGVPPVVMGTPECPSDKNLPGCPCTTPGMTAACWTGLRKNRNHGVCHDGMTTCSMVGEQLIWGPCGGEQLPNGATGKNACTCFSGGTWAIANLEPCFLTVTNGGTMTTTAFASTPAASPSMAPTCPFDMSTGVPTIPASWSSDTLQADCTGSFTLCYTIKAGDPKNAQTTDCVLAKACSSGYYGVANQTQMWPDLAGWVSGASMSACVQQFVNTGGYGEMSVHGQSDECDAVDKVFQRVTYCPSSCNTNPAGAGCQGCGNGGSGMF
jgi:hypothetical protein